MPVRPRRVTPPDRFEIHRAAFLQINQEVMPFSAGHTTQGGPGGLAMFGQGSPRRDLATFLDAYKASISWTRMARVSIAKGFVRTCMPAPRELFPSAALSA